MSTNTRVPGTKAGEADPSFGQDGKVVLSSPTARFEANFANLLLPDGKTIASSITYDGTYLIRLLSNGEVDATFGEQGYAKFNMSNHFPYFSAFPEKITRLPNGKLLVAFIADDIIDLLPGLALFHEDGRLDTEFGVAGYNIYFVKPIQAAIPQHRDRSLIRPLSSGGGSGMAEVLPDGKIIMAYRSINYYEFSYHSYLLRINPDGTLDTSFQETGFIEFSYSGRETRVVSLAVQADGKLLVAGTAGGEGFVGRFHENGDIDNSYGRDGYFVSQFFPNAANKIFSSLLPVDNKLLVVGSVLLLPGRDRRLMLVKINDDGTPDVQFNGGDPIVTGLGLSHLWQSNDAQMLDNGRIVIVGIAFEVIGTVLHASALTLRYLPTGELDNTFGNGLGYTIDKGVQQHFTVAVQPDGRINTASAGTPTESIALACRYLG